MSEVVDFPGRQLRSEMRCGGCGGGIWSWQQEDFSPVLRCLLCGDEYTIPVVLIEDPDE